MCGWHNKRSDGATLPVVLLGALIGLISPSLGGWAELRADDEPSETDDDTDTDDAPPTVTATTLEVLGRLRTPAHDAQRRPESATAVLIDDSVPPTATVADALLRVAGATIRRTGGPLDPSFVSIRGSSARQVAVFVDGVPLNNFGADAVDLAALPLPAFDRIEVYRGFAPPHLGGFAIGGAVDLISDPDRLPPPRLEVSYGSWHTRRVAMSGAVPLPNAAGHMRAHVGYTGTQGNYRAFSNNGTLYSASDDTITPRGNNHRDQLTGLWTLAARVGRVDLRILDLASWSDGGEPGAYSVQSTETRSRSIGNLIHARARAQLAPTVALTGGLGWRIRSDLYEDLLGEVGVGNQDQRNHVHSVDGDLSAALDPLPWLRLRPSVRGHLLVHRSVEHLPTTQRGPLHRRIGGQFALDAQFTPLGDRLHARASIGALALQDGSGDPSKATSLVDVLPGLAIAVHPVPELTLRASFARAVRAPTFVEMFGDRGAVVGNPDLRPERATQVDGGVGLTLGESAGSPVLGSVEVGGFVREVDDLIVLVPNSARVGVPLNLARVRLAGIESHGALSVHDLFVGRVAVTANLGSQILRGESGTLGNRVPNVPAWQVSASFAFVYRQFVRVQWSFVGLGGTFDSPSNFFEQSARPLHDLHLRVQPAPRAPWVALDLRNVFDTFIGSAYRNPLRPAADDVAPVPLQDFRGQPLPGRSFMLTVGWSPAPRSPGDSP